jgi:predicted MFS family arabinose efflux permease
MRKEIDKQNYSLMTFVLFWTGLVVMVSLYITIPLISVFSNSFHVSVDESAWTSSTFSLFFAIGCIFYGPLSERFGRKRVMVIGLGTLAVVSFAIGLINNFYFLLLMRALQGAAAATFSPVALAYITEMFPASKKITTTGFVSTGFLMAGIIGQVYSSWINRLLDWHYVFFLLGVIYMLTFFLLLFLLPKDVNHGFKPISQISSMLKNKSLLFAYMITITVLLSFVGMYSSLGIYLSSSKFGLSDQEILYIRAVGIIGMIMSPFAGKLVHKVGILNGLRIGLGFSTIGLITAGFSTNLSVLIIVSVIFVSGIAITVPTLIHLIGQLGGKQKGIAISLYTFILFLGASIGPILSTTLTKSNVTLSFEVFGVILAISVLLTIPIQIETGVNRENAESNNPNTSL